MSDLYPVAHLTERDNALYLEEIALNDVAREFGTPVYVYSKAALQDAWSAWEHSVDDRQMHVCYAVKACSNLSILRLFAERGAFFDTVSEGEIARVLAVGVPANRIVFSGVAKSEREIEFALTQGIFCFNVESVPELQRIHAIATRLGKRAPISLRVNPDVDAKTHPYISTGLKANKFGISHTDALAVYQRAASLPGLFSAKMDNCFAIIWPPAPSLFLPVVNDPLGLAFAFRQAVRFDQIDPGRNQNVAFQLLRDLAAQRFQLPEVSGKK